MSFRFGSCAVVLARKYVLLLLGFSIVIGGIHFMRSGRSSAGDYNVADAVRKPVSPETWANFSKDCSFKSYLGNPIHVTTAFAKKYRDNTFRWQGEVIRVETAARFLWWHSRGAVLVRMDPPQFPKKPDMPDLVLSFDDDAEVAKIAAKLKRRQVFTFEMTMALVGRRGSPHVGALWEITPGALPDARVQPGDQTAPNAPASMASVVGLSGASPNATVAGRAAGT